MGFLMKRVLGELLMPLPAFLLLGTAGWLLWRREGRHARLGRRMVGGSLAALALLSLGPVSTALSRRVEGGYPAFAGDSVAYVVVLGHGHVSDPRLPPGAMLSSQALYRLVEGMRIAGSQPWTTLVLSGYGGVDPRPNALVYLDVAVSMGFPRERTLVEPRPRDTAEEAQLLAPILRGHRFALVTSSTHMPRAVALFRGQGLEPVPAPTGHLVKESGRRDVLETVVPDEEYLVRSRQAWYEILGRIWARLRRLD